MWITHVVFEVAHSNKLAESRLLNVWRSLLHYVQSLAHRSLTKVRSLSPASCLTGGRSSKAAGRPTRSRGGSHKPRTNCKHLQQQHDRAITQTLTSIPGQSRGAIYIRSIYIPPKKDTKQGFSVTNLVFSTLLQNLSYLMRFRANQSDCDIVRINWLWMLYLK